MLISLRRKSVIAAGIGLLIALSGCAPVPPKPDAPLRESNASLLATHQLADPLAAYAQDPTVLITVQRAVDVLSTQCMKHFGNFTVKPANYNDLAASFVEGDSRLYGITDPIVAAQYGYLPATVPLVPDPPEETTDEFRLIYLGLRRGQNPAQVSDTQSPGTGRGKQIPAGGCLGNARKAITGEITGRPQGQASLGFELDVTAWAEAWTDPETTRAKSDWSNCMAAHGYRMFDPLNDAPTRAAGPASKSEIQQALTDISCKKSTNFISRANTVNARFAQQALLANTMALQPSKSFNEEALQNAQAALNGTP
ncbi:hypothetical protein BH09ACT2_BH09ACT2_04340 [soil metagenome]